MSIPLVHYFHAKTGTVKNVCPGVDDMTVTGLDGLVEVKTIQVKRHSANTKSSKPDADNRPRSQEEVQ